MKKLITGLGLACWWLVGCQMAGQPLPTATPIPPLASAPTNTTIYLALPAVAVPGIVEPTPVPTESSSSTFASVILIPAPLDCTTEAAFALAQAHSDLLLAAESARAQTDPAAVPQLFAEAQLRLQEYAVPACLTDAKNAGIANIASRTAAYQAAAQQDSAAHDSYLIESDSYRQMMLQALEPFWR